jgi:multisite-specific tRNA:(cytosine-C5)-methyltransferase
MDLLSKADMQNVRFAAYYRAQKIVPEEEWESLLNALKAPLPTVFRVGGSRATAKSLNDTIKNIYVPTLSGTTFEGESVPPPEQIPWYPEGLAWQFNVPKKVLRKSAEFKKFHSWLVFETEVGNVSRQEAVSMLPPLFLDVEPHHMVIDMCAAPGSKVSFQLASRNLAASVEQTDVSYEDGAITRGTPRIAQPIPPFYTPIYSNGPRNCE